MYPLGALVEIYREESINLNIEVDGNRPEDRLQIDLLEYARDAVNLESSRGQSEWMGLGYPAFAVYQEENNSLILYSWNYVSEYSNCDGYMLATKLNLQTLEAERVVDQFKFSSLVYSNLGTSYFPITYKNNTNKFFRKEQDLDLICNLHLNLDDNFSFERHLEVLNAIKPELRVSISKIKVNNGTWRIPNSWNSTKLFFFIISDQFSKFLNCLKSRC